MGSFAQTMELDVPLLFYNKEALLLATFNPNSLARPADMMNNLKGKSMAFSLKSYYERVFAIFVQISQKRFLQILKAITRASFMLTRA